MVGSNYIKKIYKELVGYADRIETPVLKKVVLGLLGDADLMKDMLYRFINGGEEPGDLMWTEQSKLYRRSFWFEMDRLKEQGMSDEELDAHIRKLIEEGLQRAGCVSIMYEPWRKD